MRHRVFASNFQRRGRLEPPAAIGLLVGGCLLASPLGPLTVEARGESGEPDRVALRQVDTASATLHWVVDERLDLATRLARLEGDAAASLVPLAPRMVVGQGAHPTNRSVVRVLNRYGIAEAQFLAFDPSDRGGVRVTAGQDPEGHDVIAAALFEPRGRPTVRLFNAAGGLQREIPSPLESNDPLLLQLGDFLPDHAGDELAIVPATSSNRGTPLIVLDLQGQPLHETQLDLPPRQQLTLGRQGGRGGIAGRLMVHARPDHLRLIYDAAASRAQTYRHPGLDPDDRVYPAQLGGGDAVAAGDDDLQSFLKPLAQNAARPAVDVGLHENQFWISPGTWSPQQRGGPYVRVVQDYAHLRMDLGNPVLTPAEAWDQPDIWPRIEAATVKQWANNLRPLGQQPLRMWEPTVTHRMNWEKANPWAQRQDPATGLPRFLALDRDNQPQSYGEFGKANQFHTFTYGYGDTALDQLYGVPLLQFLRRLAVPFRDAPERMLCLEPNHEHEIAIGEAGSVGDYHPLMIENFRDYLRRHFGPDPAVAERFGLPAGPADAPRDRGRGPWDRFDLRNDYYLLWIAFQRQTVNRRLADSFVAALAAGFPPEIVKSHQIPDTFAVGSTQTFSDRKARITPVDYALSAGVGFGFTRYGIWFKKPSNMLQAAHTSGFRSIVMGEYQGLTPDAGPAIQQLRHLFENGVTAVHAMDWPASHDKGFNASMRQAIATLLGEQKPRPGLAGGVGRVVPVTTNTRRYDVAVIGSGPAHTGLLKSLDAQGRWEGTVYCVPFRSAIDLESVRGRTTRLPDGGLEARYELAQFDSGQQLHLTLAGRGRAADTPPLRLDVQRHGASLPGFATTLPVEPEAARQYRVVLRNQLPADGLELVLQLPPGFDLTESATATLLSDDLARLHRNDDRGNSHRGSIEFDTLALP